LPGGIAKSLSVPAAFSICNFFSAAR
jgi:hypothetical protein